jgi:N6-L-threonylcarbamoyladenine synthase
MTQSLTLLGLESSCDDTAAAVVRQEPGKRAQVLSSIVFGQTELHSAFGGVVPEIAARAHAEKLDLCVIDALEAAGVTLQELDAIAVTAGPGLIGGVMSGVMCAKGIAAATGLPLVGVNHLAGHALTPRLTDDVAYPYLMLLVSGGHCQYLIARGPEDFVWAAPLMTPRARPLIKPRGCWACRNPVVLRCKKRPKWAIPNAFAFPVR